VELFIVEASIALLKETLIDPEVETWELPLSGVNFATPVIAVIEEFIFPELPPQLVWVSSNAKRKVNLTTL